MNSIKELDREPKQRKMGRYTDKLEGNIRWVE